LICPYGTVTYWGECGVRCVLLLTRAGASPGPRRLSPGERLLEASSTLAFLGRSIMSRASTRTCVYVVCLAAASMLHFVTAVAQALKGGEQPRDDKPAAIVGVWKSTERHVALASLFQPEHGVRKRRAGVHFKQAGDRLTGQVVAEDVQEGWTDGRTDFRKVTFIDDRLVFEFDIAWRKEHGPLAVEAGRLENKGTVRVEARLHGDRLAGTWKMFLVDGTEVFRGEWEAVRVKESQPADARSDPESERKALAALREIDPIVKFDETKPGRFVVAVQFRPNAGKVTDDDLVHLRAFPNLRSVDLTNKQLITDAGLAHLAGLTQLEELCLNGTKVTAAAVVRFVKDRTKLQRLELRRVRLQDDDLADLKA